MLEVMPNNVIGPVSRARWLAMRGLREDVAVMKANNSDGKYTDCIDREKRIYRAMLKPLLAA